MDSNWSISGQGFDTCKIKTTKEKLVNLLNMTVGVKIDVEEYLKDYYETNLEDATLEEILDYNSKNLLGEPAIATILQETIQELEKVNLCVYDGALFVPCVLPWAIHKITERNLSEHDYYTIFTKYISLLTDEELSLFETFYFYE